MGRVVREHHFLGALTRAARHEDMLAIPRIGRRVRASVHRAGVHLESYTGQRMLEVIVEYLREELFWAGADLLHDLAAGVPALTQPRRMRLFVAREPFRMAPSSPGPATDRPRIGESLSRGRYR